MRSGFSLAGRLELSEEVALSVASMSFVDPSLQRLAARRVAPDDASQRVGHAFDLVLDVKNIAATPNSIGDRSTTPLMTPANSAAAACTLCTVPALIDAFAAGALERVELKVKMLIARAHACISNLHGGLVFSTRLVVHLTSSRAGVAAGGAQRGQGANAARRSAGNPVGDRSAHRLHGQMASRTRQGEQLEYFFLKRRGP